MGTYFSHAKVLVPKSFKQVEGLKAALEKEFPGVKVDVIVREVPRAAADQIFLTPDHPFWKSKIGKTLPENASPETATDFLLTELQKGIDQFCQSARTKTGNS